jgi:uncharacterized phage protein (TIGR01671 family)
MREHKYRAWNSEKKTMRIHDVVVCNGKQVIPVQTSGNDYWDATWEECENILMQSTGLKDKNGVEIYENDIIVGQFGYKEVVKIEEFNFITREDSCAGYGFKLDSCNLDDIKKHVEVIGNIYENPELLDKK